jgi:hypothetical protein
MALLASTLAATLVMVLAGPVGLLCFIFGAVYMALAIAWSDRA